MTQNDVHNYAQHLRTLRATFRTITGHQSDSAWYSFKKTLEKLELITQHDYQANIDNVRACAQLKQQQGKANVPLEELIRYHQSVEGFVKALNGRLMNGEQICDYIRSQGIPLPLSTRTDWFKAIGGYKASFLYQSEQLKQVLLKAALYLARKHKQGK